jgi:hypothetical protein
MEKSRLIWLVVGMILSFMAGGVVITNATHPDSALAQGTGEQIGRYQISSWASYSGERIHHSGYYVLDTVTGKVVDSEHEIHGITSGPESEVDGP